MRRWLSVGLKAIAVLLSLVLIAVVAGMVWLGSESGRDFVLRTAADAAKDSGLAITFNGVEGSLLGTLTIGDLALDDRDGRWLDATNLKLAWHPWQLLRGRVHVSEVAADTLAVHRSPNLPPSEAETGAGGMPSIPVRIDLDRLAVAKLDLGEPLFGRAVTMRIDAYAGASRNAGNLGLHVHRTDAPGLVDLEARFNVPDDALTLELQVDEPSGGLIAEMAGLEGAPPVHVDLTGEGPLSQWRGRLRAMIDNEEALTLRASVDGRETRTITLDGQIGLQPLATVLPEGLIDLIGPQIAVFGKTVIDPKTLRVESFDIDSAGATLSLAGDYGFAAGDWNGAAKLLRVSPDLAHRFGVAVDQPVVALEGHHLRGRTEAKVHLAASELESQGVTLDGLQAVFEASRPNDTAPWQIAAIADGSVAALPGAPSSASDKLLGPLSLVAHGSVAPAGAMNLDDLRFTLGPATLVASGQYDGQQADGSLSLDVSDLASFIPGADSTEPSSARFATAMNYSESKGLALSDMTLELPGGQITGQVELDAAFERIDAGFKSAGLDLGPLGKLLATPVAGNLDLTTSITGALADPAVTAQVRLQKGSFDGNTLPPAELRADVKAVVSAPQGNVALTVRPPQGALALSTQFAMPNADTLELKTIKIDGPGVNGGGDVRLSLAHSLATGQVKLDAPDLGPLLAVAGLGGGGNARLRLSLAAPKSVQQADLTGSVASLAVSQGDADLVRIGKAEINAKGALSGKSPITAKLSADAIAAGGAEVRRVTLGLRGTADQMTFDLRVNAPAYEDLQLALTGTLRTERDVRTIRLTRGNGSLRQQPFTIQPGMTAVVAPNAYQLRGFKISGRGLGEASAEGSMKGATIGGNLTVRGLPLSLLSDPDAEEKALGQVDLTATASGTTTRPKGTINLAARGVALAGDRAGGKADATAEITVDDKSASLQLTVANLSAEPLRASASLTRTPKGLGFDDSSALSGRLSWNGAIGDITKFAPLVGQQVTGNLVADLTLSGTLGKPGIAGSATISDGTVEDYATGLVLRFPRLELVGDTRRLELRPFEAFDPNNGKIAGHAAVDLDSAAGFPLSAQLDFTRARVLGRDEIMAILSGTITAEGSLKTLNVRGALRSDRVEVDLDTGLPPSVVTLDVTEIPADQGAGTQKVAVRNKPEEPKDEESFASEILLDIKLDLPGQVFVRGHGLDSEWEGNISVAGNAAKPRVTGQLTSRRGRIDFIEKSFTLESSTIDLAPKADGSVDALLNIKAVNESNDLTVTVTVSGTATSPSIALSANPAMPQDEILSRLLFGKNRASLSPIEAVQLAQALRSLSGGGGPSMMTRLRRMLGVDVLRVDSGNGSDSSPSLEAGKYVTDKVYVGVKQGASQGSSAVAVDVDVLKNMSVGTEIRQDGTNQVGVKYKWDY